MKRLGMTGQAGDCGVRALALRLAAMTVGGVLLASAGMPVRGETCTTQSALAADERAGIAEAARSLAEMVQANNLAGLRAGSVAS